MADYCGAKTRAGGKCTRPPGWGTGHPGIGSCKFHGGSTRNHEVAAAVTLARRELAVMGRPLDIEPHEALLECVRITAGEVQYASDRIAELDIADAVGPVVTERPRKGEYGMEEHGDNVRELGPPALHIWIVVRQHAMDRLVNYAKIALVAGIAERQVKIAEQQGQLLAEVIRGILRDLGVDDRPEAPAIVRKHLSLVAGRAAS